MHLSITLSLGSGATRAARRLGLLGVLYLGVACNAGSFDGSSKTAKPGAASAANGSAAEAGARDPKDPLHSQDAERKRQSATDPASEETAQPTPVEEIDSGSAEACMSALQTTGFRDPSNGRTYRMLKKKYNFCDGHQKCWDIAKGARFPVNGEKASDDILKCTMMLGSWIDMNAKQGEEVCKNGGAGRFNLADTPAGLGLYTFEAQGIARPSQLSNIICVYKE